MKPILASLVPIKAHLMVLFCLVVITVRLPAAEAFDLTTDLQHLPLAIDSQAPRFSWKMVASTNAAGQPVRGQVQTAYRILVASAANKLVEGSADIFDSGRVTDFESVLIDWKPTALLSKTRYHWTVKIWDQDGVAGNYASPVWFETGMLQQEDWMRDGAAWIESPLEPEANENMKAWLKHAVVPFDHLEIGGTAPTPDDLIKSRSKLDEMFTEKIGSASLLRREFEVPAQLASARLYICGLGYYRAYANGVKIGDRMLPPSDTDFQTQAYYQAYDVTGLLKAGKTNCLGVELVNGRWRAWPGLTPETYHGRPILLARLELTDKNGRRQTIVTDGNWQAGRHGIERHGFWQGEIFDANVFPEGWSTPRFKHPGWVPARNSKASARVGPLRWDPMPPEKLIERGHPVSQTEPAPKVFAYDFGKQLAGRARYTFRNLKKGQRVVVRYSTATTGECPIYTLPYYPGFNNTAQRPGMLLFKRRDAISFEHGPERYAPNGKAESLHAKAGTVVYTDMFVSAGRPVEVWQPDFTYLGFRHLEILGLDKALPTRDIMGFDLRTSPRIVGTLSTDNEKLNQVLGGIQNTLLQGFHSQLQDNNGSERNPNGVNDALNHLVTGYWFDTYPLWLKTLDNTAKLSTRNQWPANMVAGMRNHPGQRKERYILIVDCFHYGQTPLDMFRFYRDARAITPMIPWMEAWLAETSSHTVWGKVTAYGDHIAASALANLQPLWGDKKTAPPTFVQAAAVMKIGRENIDLYQAMGLTDKAAQAEKALEPFKARLRQEFYDSNASQWLPEVLTRQQINSALYAWKVDPTADVNRLAEQVVKEFQTLTHGHQITGSRLSDPLLHLLTHGGHVDEAVRLLEREEYPSLLNMIRETGGNIRESWGKDDSFSQIEGLTGMGNWFYRDLVGIAPDLAAPAFKHFTLRPAVPTRVNSIQFAYDSPRGPIKSRFEKNGRQADWKVIVPPNTTATVTFPAPSLDLITESNRPLAGVVGITIAEPVDGRPSARLVSGTYHFAFPLKLSRP